MLNNKIKSEFLSLGNLYRLIIGPILSKDEGIDAERLTNIALSLLGTASLHRKEKIWDITLNKLRKELTYQDNRLEQKLFNCSFNNPVGLAAGFDKNGIAAGIWESFGFGFAEIGTVTWHAQSGNPKPRLFRLANEEAALNRMGFNNRGAKKVLDIINSQRIDLPSKRDSIIGINLGKSKITSLENAPDDYYSSLEILAAQANYVVINVSSPNTPGLRDLQNTEQLRKLLSRLKSMPKCPPLLIKIAPDLTDIEIDSLTDLADSEGVSGLIAVNTSLNRFGLEKKIITQTGLPLGIEAGGLSGVPLKGRAVEVIKRIFQRHGEKLPLIGVGGIDTPQSAWERITAGSSLIQLYTGWIFQGPTLVPNILRGLTSQIEKHGLKNISEAIGTDAPWI